MNIRSFLTVFTILINCITIYAQTYFGSQNIIQNTNVYGAHCVFATDIDGDGDMDALSASYDDDKVAWYQNDGRGGYFVSFTKY